MSNQKILYKEKQKLYIDRSIFDNCCKQWPKLSFLKPMLNENQPLSQQFDNKLYLFELHWIIPQQFENNKLEEIKQIEDNSNNESNNYHLQLSDLNSINEPVTKLWADCYRISVLLHAFYQKPYNALSIYIKNDDSDLKKFMLLKVKECHLKDSKYGRNFPQKLGYTFLKYLFERKKADLEKISAKTTKRKNNNDSNAKIKGNEKQYEQDSIVLKQKVQKNKMLASLESFNKEKLKTTKTNVRYQGCIDGKHGISLDNNDQDNNDENKEDEPSLIWDIYAKMYLASNLNEKYLKNWSQQFGFNENLEDISVGDILLTIPCVESSLWSRFVKCSYNPNFHYAVVIMIDKQHSTYITLENWAVNDSNATNNKWDYRIYKNLNGKSYHEQLCNSNGYGNVAMTLLLKIS